MSVSLTPTTAERLTKLEAETVTLKMQARATLQSLQQACETLDKMAEAISLQQQRLMALDRTYRDMLLRNAVQMALDFDVDDQQPTWDDIWQTDVWKLGEDIIHRVEEHIL